MGMCILRNRKKKSGKQWSLQKICRSWARKDLRYDKLGKKDSGADGKVRGSGKRRRREV